MRFEAFSRLMFLSLAILLLSATGCKPKLLPNSNVRDTAENRAIMSFMEQYKAAIEHRSIAEVMALVSQDYFEDNATPEASDDYDYSKLEQNLQKTFEHMKESSMRYYVQNIEKKGDNLEVVYYFNQQALVTFPAGEQWMAANDVNRLVLKPKGPKPENGYEVLRGL